MPASAGIQAPVSARGGEREGRPGSEGVSLSIALVRGRGFPCLRTGMTMA